MVDVVGVIVIVAVVVVAILVVAVVFILVHQVSITRNTCKHIIDDIVSPE